MEQAEGYAELIESGQPGKIYSCASSFCMFVQMSQDGYAGVLHISFVINIRTLLFPPFFFPFVNSPHRFH